MSRNRKNAAINLGQLLKVVLLIALIGGAALGYVWQKNQIDKLAAQKREREAAIAKLKHDNEFLANQIRDLQQSVKLIPRISELQLGLVPRQESQVVRLTEPRDPSPGENNLLRQFTRWSVDTMTP